MRQWARTAHVLLDGDWRFYGVLLSSIDASFLSLDTRSAHGAARIWALWSARAPLPFTAGYKAKILAEYDAARLPVPTAGCHVRSVS